MPTPNMNLTQPTVGGSTDTWGTTLNTDLDLLDAHDHTSTKGVKVPSAGININADLTFAGFSATNIRATAFSAVTAFTTAKSLFVKSGDNELYWRTNGGTDVKLTNGNSINTTLVGGITGDYSTTNADVEYVDAEKAYEFKQDESPDHWANLKTGNIRIHEPTSGITNDIEIKSPTSLAAAYDLTLPAALPASAALVTLSSAGVLGSALQTALPSLTSTGTITAAILVTAEAEAKHGDRVERLAMPIFSLPGTALVGNPGGDESYGTTSSASFSLPITVPIGSRIKNVTAHVIDNVATGISLIVRSATLTTGSSFSATTHATVSTSVNSATIQLLSSGALSVTVVAETTYYALLSLSNVGHKVFMVTVTYDRV